MQNLTSLNNRKYLPSLIFVHFGEIFDGFQTIARHIVIAGGEIRESSFYVKFKAKQGIYLPTLRIIFINVHHRHVIYS